MRTHTRTHSRTHTRTHAHTHTRTHAHTHTRTHVYVPIHTCYTHLLYTPAIHPCHIGYVLHTTYI
nr:MAG TPA: hypothetical protein [Caudoviricetes sp.]